MAAAQQQSSSHCDSTNGQKRNRPLSRWPKSSLQEPGSKETISLLGLITSVTRQEGLQTTGISSSTSVYRNTDVEKEEAHCVQLSPGCLHSFGVQSTQVYIPSLDGLPTSHSFYWHPVPWRETVCSHIYTSARSHSHSENGSFRNSLELTSHLTTSSPCLHHLSAPASTSSFSFQSNEDTLLDPSQHSISSNEFKYLK